MDVSGDFYTLTFPMYFIRKNGFYKQVEEKEYKSLSKNKVIYEWWGTNMEPIYVIDIDDSKIAPIVKFIMENKGKKKFNIKLWLVTLPC